MGNHCKLEKEVDTSLNVTELVVGALSLTAALAWNEAAKSGIASIVPGKKGTFQATLIYAMTVTVFVIIILSIVRKVRDNFVK